MRRLLFLLALVPGMARAQQHPRIHVRIVGDTTWTESSDGSAVRTVQRGDTLWERRFPAHADDEMRWIIHGWLATREDAAGQTVYMLTYCATLTRRYAFETAAREARLRAMHVPDVP